MILGKSMIIICACMTVLALFSARTDTRAQKRQAVHTSPADNPDSVDIQMRNVHFRLAQDSVAVQLEMEKAFSQ